MKTNIESIADFLFLILLRQNIHGHIHGMESWVFITNVIHVMIVYILITYIWKTK